MHSSRAIAAAGVVGCVFALLTLVWYTMEHAAGQVWVLLIMIVLAAFVEAAYLLFLKKPGKASRIGSR